MQPDPGEIDDGWDAVRLDILPWQVAGALEMLHVHDGSLQPVAEARGAQHVAVAGVGEGHVGLGVRAEPWRSQGASLAPHPPSSVEDVQVGQVGDEVLGLSGLPAFLADLLQHALGGGQEVHAKALPGPVNVDSVGRTVCICADAGGRVDRACTERGQDADEDLVLHAPLGDEVPAQTVERGQALHQALHCGLREQ